MTLNWQKGQIDFYKLSLMLNHELKINLILKLTTHYFILIDIYPHIQNP